MNTYSRFYTSQLLLPEPMEHLKNLDLSDLLDLLIEQTTHHTHLISIGGTPEEFRVSREILRSLQTEIQTRNEIIDTPPNF